MDPFATISAPGDDASGAHPDPVSVVELAMEQDMAAQETEATDPDRSKEDLVREWWQRTSETQGFELAVKQYDADLKTINGDDEDKDDEDAVTVNHIYRNAVQTVALTVPEMSAVTWKPRDEVKPIPGVPLPPQFKDLLTQRSNQQKGLAAVLSILWQRFAEQGNLQEKIEAWVQEGVHHRLSVFKIWWQRDLTADPLSETRLPDEQDLCANARLLVEQYDRGEFTKDDARYQTMAEALKAIGRTEADVKRGIMVEQRPLKNYRCDPSVTHPAYKDSATWESDDVLMTRDEILAKWDHISTDDLARGVVYDVDATGAAIRREREVATTTAGTMTKPEAVRNTVRLKGDDWLLCREIYDYATNHRLVLVEGLPYPAVEEPLERGPAGMSPFVLLVSNPRPMGNGIHGFSDTELQAKLQRQINRKRTQEEDARNNAQPRWAYDPLILNDAEVIKKLNNTPPWSMTPVPTGGKSLKDALIPLAGNHEFNPAEYDTGPLVQEMRKMAALPEQSAGELGQAEFATEVQVAAAGANSLARYRQARISRALKQLADKAAHLILLNCSQDLAVRLAGPLAALYYPMTPPDRREIYDGLTITAEPALDKQLDYAKRADSLVKLVEAFGNAGVAFDKETAARLLARFLNLGEDGEALVQSDPNDLIMRLVEMVQKNPGALAPEAVQALTATFMPIVQQQAMKMQQMQAQQQASGQPAPAAAQQPQMA